MRIRFDFDPFHLFAGYIYRLLSISTPSFSMMMECAFSVCDDSLRFPHTISACVYHLRRSFGPYDLISVGRPISAYACLSACGFEPFGFPEHSMFDCDSSIPPSTLRLRFGYFLRIPARISFAACNQFRLAVSTCTYSLHLPSALRPRVRRFRRGSHIFYCVWALHSCGFAKVFHLRRLSISIGPVSMVAFPPHLQLAFPVTTELALSAHTYA
jgi:hypothetical protein